MAATEIQWLRQSFWLNNDKVAILNTVHTLILIGQNPVQSYRCLFRILAN